MLLTFMRRRTASLSACAGILLFATPWVWAQAADAGAGRVQAAIPDAPQPQPEVIAETAESGPADLAGGEAAESQSASGQKAAADGQKGAAQAQSDAPQPEAGQGADEQEQYSDEKRPAPQLLIVPVPPGCAIPASTKTPPDRSCVNVTPAQNSERYRRFSNSPAAIALTPKQKFRLAARNVYDPFNLMSIAFFSGLDVASNSHGAYGPGMAGFGREFGTTLTENINGEFWGTFVMASITHQDPHYHRMPDATIQRRILHCITAVVWAQSDHGRPMPNFVEIGGYSVAASINNLYVPYKSTNVQSTVERVTVAMALDPIGNAVTEFLPDVAKRLNIRVVFVQQIINKVAAIETGNNPQ